MRNIYDIVYIQRCFTIKILLRAVKNVILIHWVAKALIYIYHLMYRKNFMRKQMRKNVGIWKKYLVHRVTCKTNISQFQRRLNLVV